MDKQHIHSEDSTFDSKWYNVNVQLIVQHTLIRILPCLSFIYFMNSCICRLSCAMQYRRKLYVYTKYRMVTRFNIVLSIGSSDRITPNPIRSDRGYRMKKLDPIRSESDPI